jgi:hypothetical protein
MGDRYDIFFSYAHADKKAVKPLLDAFAAKAIKVFHDDTEIIDGQSISRRITDGLSDAKILVAWYSKTYPTRRACQWELTAAIIAAQRDSSDIRAVENRILALNPETTRTHIQPLHIQDQRYIAAYDVDADKLAQQVFDHLQRVDQTFGEFHHLPRPHWFGSNMRLGSNRFVGRVADLWAIHSGLLKHNFAMITGGGTGLVQVQGMGGIGKTLLAEEYALRFGSLSRRRLLATRHKRHRRGAEHPSATRSTYFPGKILAGGICLISTTKSSIRRATAHASLPLAR